tara:strand:+ start:163 stop:651 length:489 start_codon:yes stop_codon:yes gene_type:complete
MAKSILVAREALKKLADGDMRLVSDIEGLFRQATETTPEEVTQVKATIGDVEADILANDAAIANVAFDLAVTTASTETNAADVLVNAAAILANTDAIAVNTSDIATNAADIATNAGGIAANASAITGLDTRVDALEGGVSGSFTTADGKTVTVSGGIITAIV